MIKTLILGAGHEVGKSCVVVTVGGKNIMFDCGMHMGYSDERRFPDFSLISKRGDFTQVIDCVIVTHFHLDHVGALPYFTEVCGYEGPIFMTYPTKALAPLMLEDYRKVMVERRGEQEQFSVLQIHDCMKKVTAVDLRQTVSAGTDLQLRAYYAGHVLGAAMFYVKVGESSIVYTGDYNMTPDRHLGAAQIDRLQPDLVITESTYATTIRDSKHARERDFLKAVHTCIAAGGKVLIPVFALGRAQELCILLDDYWERMNLKAPIYFSAGLTMQANIYYKLLISWTSQRVKETCVTRNAFDFKHVSAFDRSQMNAPGPCVLFATPGMLSGGLSLEVFKQWAPFEKNMVVVPGYCVPGTVGFKLVQGKSVKIDIDKRTQLDVRCQVHHLSFSAHTDAKGIMDLLRHVGPKHVILVHGERPKMALLKSRIISELGVPCYDPGNGEAVEVPSRIAIKVIATERFLAGGPSPADADEIDELDDQNVYRNLLRSMPSVDNNVRSGVIMMDRDRTIQVLQPDEVLPALNVSQHNLMFKCRCPIYRQSNTGYQGNEALTKELNTTSELPDEPPMKKYQKDIERIPSLDLEREPENSGVSVPAVPSVHSSEILDAVHAWLIKWLGPRLFTKQDDCIVGRSVCIRVCTDDDDDDDDDDAYQQVSSAAKSAAAMVVCTWSLTDERLANRAISLISTMRLV